MPVPKFICSDFVKRQTKNSEFSSFMRDDWNEVLKRTISDWDKRVQGYREGVYIVPISNVEGFFTSTCILSEGDILYGEYKSRVPGEKPRKSVHVMNGKKSKAIKVDIIVYHRDVLAEGNENTRLFEDTMFYGRHKGPFAEYEIISINASISNGIEPMSPGTLMANHFHVNGSNDGGTSTGMTDSEFVIALKESYLYWNDKSKAQPSR